VINFTRFPYLRIAIVLVAGMFTFYLLDTPSYVLAILLVILSFIFLAGERLLQVQHKKPFIQGCLLLLSVFTAGGFMISQKNESIRQNVLHQYINKKIKIYGTIAEVLKSSGNHKFLLKNEYFKTEKGEIFNDDTRIILKFAKNDSLASKYKPGDRVVSLVSLNSIPSNSNPEAFDYAFYLKTKGIIFQSFVKGNHHAQDITSDHNVFWDIVGKTSAFASNTLNKYIMDEENNAIAHALLLGQTLLISEDIYKSYADTGAIHVLSVSGLHVAIFISLFVWFFSKINDSVLWWKFVKVVALLIIVWFYVVLTGMSPSVVRAGTMVSLYIIGTHFFKGTNSFNLLSIAAICMLIYNPLYLFQASFQFSYLSLLSILYFQPKFASWWQPSATPIKFFWDLINVSLAAQILVFPVTVFYFHQFPSYFAISGIIAVPLVTIIIYIGTILIAMEGVFVPLNNLVGPILNGMIEILNDSIKFISSWPSSIISGIWISETALILLLLMVIFLILWFETRNTKVFYGLLFLTFMGIFEHGWRKTTNTSESKIYVYDMFGSCLVDIISGGKVATIKTGVMQEKSENFAALNNRIKYGVIHPDSNLSNEVMTRFWRVGSKSLYVNNKDENPSFIEPQKIDILVITKNKFNDPGLFVEKFAPEWVILDRNVPEWIEKKWTSVQQKLNFKLHLIKYNGAVEIDLLQPIDQH
jgi:competence protein ComEC